MAVGRNKGGRPRKKKRGGPAGAGFVYYRVTFYDNQDITVHKIGEALRPGALPESIVTGIPVYDDDTEAYVLAELRAGRLPDIDTKADYSHQLRGQCIAGEARIYTYDKKTKKTVLRAS